MEKSGIQWKDRLGISASVACAIHCAATPILLAFLPAMSFTDWMASPLFHQIAALVCVGMVSLAIWPAFVRFRDYRVLTLSTVGLSLLLVAAFYLPDACCTHHVTSSTNAGQHGSVPLQSDSLERPSPSRLNSASIISPELLSIVQPWMTPLGGLLLVVAHGFNLRRPVRRSVCRARGCNCDAPLTTTLASPIARREPSDRLIANATTQAA